MKKRQKPIRRVSVKRAAQLKRYFELRDKFLHEHPRCAVFPHYKPSTEVHHSRGRSGTLLNDTRFWFAVSRMGHTWIHESPAKARAEGFLCEKGLWGSTKNP